MLNVCIFITDFTYALLPVGIIHQKTVTNVKMICSRQWFENVQMHSCTFTTAHREMHLCITMNMDISQPRLRISHFHFCRLILCIFLHNMVWKNCTVCISAFAGLLGTRNFYFQDRKKIEISGLFSEHQSHKKTRFLSFRVHITSERLELRLK